MAWNDLASGWNAMSPKPKKIELCTNGGHSFLIQNTDVQLDPSASGYLVIRDNRGTGKAMVVLDKQDVVALIAKE